ncbi:hypothetical protein Tco_0701888 [Tanacetum coccineum]|uniref:Reverse transcriptase domain-containing protein n=1 Tax=Tanacetum coccineum TaxID=301880 RepID=A0ABQ4XUM1_9ASTR
MILRQSTTVIPNSQGRRVIAISTFINNDLDNLRGVCQAESTLHALSKFQRRATTQTKDPNIEDMLLLLVQGKVTNLSVEERIAFNIQYYSWKSCQEDLHNLNLSDHKGQSQELRSTGDTPFSLVYGTEAVIPAEIEMPTIRTAEVNIATNDDERRIDLDILEERREQAAIREEKAKLKMKGYYDAKVRGVSFRPGDFVYRANDASHAEDTGKLGPKWEGPYEVTEALGKGAYKLRDMDGRELPRTWNICNLKKCYL